MRKPQDYLFLIIFSLLYTGTAFAGSQMSFNFVWTVPGEQESITLDISVYIEESSQWEDPFVKERLIVANSILKKCQTSIRNVYFHSWKLPNKKLRVDDLEEKKVFYDGMRNAGQKAFKVTPIQLFYFEDYINPFTYGGSVPLAVYSEEGFPNTLVGTAWFPFQSVQRKKRLNGEATYSEEAHELGHILLESGHDHSGKKNIMANDSTLRAAEFSPEQCLNMNVPVLVHKKIQCQKTAENLLPIFKTYFFNYSAESYMSTWCSRNSDNLQKGIRNLKIHGGSKIYGIYVKNKEVDQSIFPKKARNKDNKWSYHAFLLIDGLVFDLDYGSKPKPEALEVYLKKMWGDQLKDLIFQVRDGSEMSGYTKNEVHQTFEDKTYPSFKTSEFIVWSKELYCSK